MRKKNEEKSKYRSIEVDKEKKTKQIIDALEWVMNAAVKRRKQIRGERSSSITTIGYDVS